MEQQRQSWKWELEGKLKRRETKKSNREEDQEKLRLS